MTVLRWRFLFGMALPLFGGETLPEQEAPAPLPVEGSQDGINATLANRGFLLENRLVDPFIPDAVAARLSHGLDAAADKLRLQVALSYDALAMGALNDAADWGAASGDLSLSMRWRVFRREKGSPLILAARIRDREAFGTLSPTDLRRETNALWGYADGFTGAGVEIPEFYFEDRFFKQRLLLRYGQMTPDDLLDDHRQRSGKRSFLNQAFSASPAVGFPGTGFGLVARWKSPRGWDLTAIASNLESSNVDERAKWGFNTDALFSGLQWGLNFKGWQQKDARLQVLAWNGDGLADEGLTSSHGTSLTLEQELARKTRSFLRYAWSDGNLAPVSHMFVTGFTWETTAIDRFGIGIATGAPSRPDAHRQTSLEMFYRHQVNANIVVSPDLQWAFGEQLGGDAGWLVIAGLRIGITF